MYVTAAFGIHTCMYNGSNTRVEDHVDFRKVAAAPELRQGNDPTARIRSAVGQFHPALFQLRRALIRMERTIDDRLPLHLRRNRMPPVASLEGTDTPLPSHTQ